MKNILIICIQGLTSGILARKLNMTAEDRNEEYSFLSSGIADAEKHMEWADYVILTPQVRDRMNKAEEAAARHGAECLMLADTMISFQKAEETYENIIKALGKEQSSSGHDLLRSLADTAAVLVPLSAAGLCAHMIGYFTGSLMLKEIYEKTLGIICLYALPALGFRMFQRSGESRMAGMLAGLLVLLVLTPFRPGMVYAEDSFAATGRIPDIRYWSAVYLPLYLAAGFLFLYLILAGYRRMWKYYSETRHQVADRQFLLFTAVPLTFVTALLLVFRTIVFSLL